MKKIKVNFSDFWGGFENNPTGKENYDNIFYKILSERFDVEISNNPDFLIFSVFGNNHRNYSCKKILYTGENQRPNYTLCDYSVSFDYMDDSRNLRYPLSGITLYENGIVDEFPRNIDPEKTKREKTKFCNFIFSNPNANLRNHLFQELSKYKKVDSGGRVMNNIGHLVGDKVQFLNDYKFTIAFENSEFPGYTTEKLVHPKLVDSIPIYWGNPKVGLDWNTKAIVNAYEFKSIKDIIDRIIEIDNNDDLYFKVLNEPHFNSPKSKDLDHKSFLDFIEKITK